ncbi:hypothetical protein O181_122836 [Austropuccinia psidii MF-1]|uniref:Uncharacterized protein n=1 Tax=Austropuccinia psidii MF-1 TaxID=1389203 RepID=A0A9Q3KN42_9BASI|nr:hypothetical protein [Austropuccinia psidii MF-1]
MEANIQSNHMELDKEEARTNSEVSNIPQEKHIWRMPEFHSPRSVPTKFDENFESGLIHDNNLRSEPLPSGRYRNLSIQYKSWFREAKEEES